MKLVLASGNRGKLRELSTMLAPVDVTVVAQADLGIAPAAETGLSFVENAIIKARHAARESGLPALADDSGLEVDALGGEPGIYSSRYAGADADDGTNVSRLLRALEGIPPPRRTARFRCVLVLMPHALDPGPVICEGSWEGLIIESPRGQGGFGYDPVFYVPGEDRTAAELPAPRKNQLSHRAQALAALRAALELGVITTRRPG